MIRLFRKKSINIIKNLNCQFNDFENLMFLLDASDVEISCNKIFESMIKYKKTTHNDTVIKIMLKSDPLYKKRQHVYNYLIECILKTNYKSFGFIKSKKYHHIEITYNNDESMIRYVFDILHILNSN